MQYITTEADYNSEFDNTLVQQISSALISFIYVWCDVSYLTPFFHARCSLSVDNGMIYYHHRLYIPASSRALILSQVHDTWGCTKLWRSVPCQFGGPTWPELFIALWRTVTSAASYVFVVLRLQIPDQSRNHWQRVHTLIGLITPLLEIFLL